MCCECVGDPLTLTFKVNLPVLFRGSVLCCECVGGAGPTAVAATGHGEVPCSVCVQPVLPLCPLSVTHDLLPVETFVAS